MFNKYPVNPARRAGGVRLAVGYDEVLDRLAERMRAVGEGCVLAIDGTHGADFRAFALRLRERLTACGVAVADMSAEALLKPGEEVRRRFRDNITDNRAFGYMTDGSMEDYFTEGARERCRSWIASQREQSGGARTVAAVVGTGSHWLSGGSADINLFLDISRENQQLLHKRGLTNFGLDRNEDALEKYKIAFFVEWPILEGYRKAHLAEFDWYVDMNREEEPVAISVRELHELAADVAESPIRVKPFFAPGIWGGQYLKELADLPRDWDNCAWGFEPIAPENAVLVGVGGRRIELPFLVIMQVGFRAILGDRLVRLFGDYFPIRFDYLDTIGGTNLSCQVHPKMAYIRETFGYPLEQQESYYIMERRKGAKVYLGLTRECEPEAFLEEVRKAQETGVPIAFTDYVQEWDSDKGDLFLIPTGTVHCSGKDNLVLEISATTWWFTFKLYDYVRKDADGKPRPINIDHATANIDWHKRTDWVRENLIPRPRLLGSQGRSEEYALGGRDDLLFYVNRIHLAERWEDDTNGEVLLLNLVEGERIRIRSLRRPDVAVELGYAESYILPAVLGRFEIVNLGASPCKIIKAGVSPDWDVKITDE